MLIYNLEKLGILIVYESLYYKIQTKIFQNCEHRIPQEGSSLGLEFIKKKLY